MDANRGKGMVMSWLLLSLVGVVATWSGFLAGELNTIYGLPTAIATYMLFWIRRDNNFYQQPYYRFSWQLNVVFCLLLLFPGLYQLVGQLLYA